MNLQPHTMSTYRYHKTVIVNLLVSCRISYKHQQVYRPPKTNMTIENRHLIGDTFWNGCIMLAFRGVGMSLPELFCRMFACHLLSLPQVGRLRFWSKCVTTKGKNPCYPAIVERAKNGTSLFSEEFIYIKWYQTKMGILSLPRASWGRFVFSHRVTFQDLVEESKTNGGTGGPTWGRIEVFPVNFLDAGYLIFDRYLLRNMNRVLFEGVLNFQPWWEMFYV